MKNSLDLCNKPTLDSLIPSLFLSKIILIIIHNSLLKHTLINQIQTTMDNSSNILSNSNIHSKVLMVGKTTVRNTEVNQIRVIVKIAKIHRIANKCIEIIEEIITLENKPDNPISRIMQVLRENNFMKSMSIYKMKLKLI